MVVPKGGNGRWLRKHKLFFFIGFVIFLSQIYLAARFLTLSKNPTRNEWPLTNQFIDIKPTTNSSLRLDDLNFKPPCDITTKETISAINRAKTQKCKQLIANISCLASADLLYPKYLNATCPADGRIQGKPLGCFKDENNYRLLTGFVGIHDRNSPQYCIQLCLQSGFEYAGLEYSKECFCGNNEPSLAHKLPDSSCNMKCPGDAHAVCGGYYTINVYETGIKKFSPQVAGTEAVRTHDNDVRIVFLLTINGRALRQVKRLLKILYHQRHFYYIHVDVREDYLFRELLHLESSYPNIRLTRHRFATIWGGASLLDMLLSCMRELLNTNWPWDFILNLSESDYPVKQVTALQRFLSQNRDRNFVKSHGRDTQRFLQKQGLDKTFVECELRMWRVANRRLPRGLQMDGGSDWVALSRSFVSYVAQESPDELVTGLRQVFKHTLLPAESFFHTVLRNSRFCDSYIDNNLHVTNWRRKLGCKCQYKHVVDWCGCSPNDFRSQDWGRVQSTAPRQLYFARKFEPVVSQSVLLKLELWLFNLEAPSRDVVNLHAYWQSFYHHLDLSPAVAPGVLPLLQSIVRLWRRSHLNSTQPYQVMAGTTYHLHDSYVYSLVQFTQGGDEYEVAFRPLNMTRIRSRRLESVVVSSEYDQKEQLSRNFHRVLTPDSELTLVYKPAPGQPPGGYNMTCTWYNPRGVPLETSDISVDEAAGVGFAKLGTKRTSNAPGSWRVELHKAGVLMAETRFLVLPLSEGDALVDEFYVIEKGCVVGGGAGLEACGGTSWSSHAPDPKSAIGSVNQTSGMFDIW